MTNKGCVLMKKKFTAKPSDVKASTDSDRLLGAYSEWYKVADDNDLAEYGINPEDKGDDRYFERNYGISPIGIAIIDFDKLDEITANELSNEGYDLLTIGKLDDGEIKLYMTYGDGTATTVTLSDIDRVVHQNGYSIENYPTEKEVHAYIQWVIDGELADNGYEVPEEKRDELFKFVLRELKNYLAYGDLEAWLYVDRDPYQLIYDDCLSDFQDGYPDTVIEDSVLDYVRDHGYD